MPGPRIIRLLLLIATALSAPGCRNVAPPTLERQAVIIGIDGADWKLIDELAAEGRLPNLTRLRQLGVSGPIETLPTLALSPVIWTSVATGKTPDKHGIAWFLVDRPDGSRTPVESGNRKTKAIWNILAERGHRATAVGWWATHPAEDVGEGTIVSDGVGYHGFGATARDGDDALKTHPTSLFEEIRARVPTESDISAEFARRFLRIEGQAYRNEMFDPSSMQAIDTDNPIHLFQQYALTAQAYTAIAEDLLSTRPYDLFLLYFEQVDSFCHLFMKYAPPRLPWIEQSEFDRYRDVVREWYVYQDELLGRVLSRIDLEQTAVFVLSDHGFKSGQRRIRSHETVDPRRAHLDHETHGIFLAAGPGIRRGGEIDDLSVLDITPTVLHYLGLPVGRDMDGKVLEDLFEPGFHADHPVRHVDSYEDGQPTVTGPDPQAEPIDPDVSLEQLRRLQALGYVGDSEHLPPAATEPSSPELLNNLGRALLDRGKLDEARREFERALELDPHSADALLNLGMILRLQGRFAEAEHMAKSALRTDPNSIHALAQLAEIKRDQNNLEESIRLYREAVSIDDSRPYLYVGLGDSQQRAGRYDDAERSFMSALQLDPDSFEAHYNLGVTLMAQDRSGDATARFEKALELNREHPAAGLALNNLADIHLRQGDRTRAMEIFEQAAEVSPDMLEPRFNLGSLYLDAGNASEAIEWLEMAARVAPDHELLNMRLGSAYVMGGRAEDAYRSFLLVRRLYPRNWNAALGIALLHAESGNVDEARRAVEDAVEVGGSAAARAARANPALAPLVPLTQDGDQ